jgi:hypothetical protein
MGFTVDRTALGPTLIVAADRRKQSPVTMSGSHDARRGRP